MHSKLSLILVTIVVWLALLQSYTSQAESLERILERERPAPYHKLREELKNTVIEHKWKLQADPPYILRSKLASLLTEGSWSTPGKLNALKRKIKKTLMWHKWRLHQDPTDSLELDLENVILMNKWKLNPKNGRADPYEDLAKDIARIISRKRWTLEPENVEEVDEKLMLEVERILSRDMWQQIMRKTYLLYPKLLGLSPNEPVPPGVYKMVQSLQFKEAKAMTKTINSLMQAIKKIVVEHKWKLKGDHNTNFPKDINNALNKHDFRKGDYYDRYKVLYNTLKDNINHAQDISDIMDQYFELKAKMKPRKQDNKDQTAMLEALGEYLNSLNTTTEGTVKREPEPQPALPLKPQHGKVVLHRPVINVHSYFINHGHHGQKPPTDLHHHHHHHHQHEPVKHHHHHHHHGIPRPLIPVQQPILPVQRPILPVQRPILPVLRPVPRELHFHDHTHH